MIWSDFVVINWDLRLCLCVSRVVNVPQKPCVSPILTRFFFSFRSFYSCWMIRNWVKSIICIMNSKLPNWQIKCEYFRWLFFSFPRAEMKTRFSISINGPKILFHLCDSCSLCQSEENIWWSFRRVTDQHSFGSSISSPRKQNKEMHFLFLVCLHFIPFSHPFGHRHQVDELID